MQQTFRSWGKVVRRAFGDLGIPHRWAVNSTGRACYDRGKKTVSSNTGGMTGHSGMRMKKTLKVVGKEPQPGADNAAAALCSRVGF